MSSQIPSKRPAPVDFAQQLAEAKKRAAEVKARLEAAKAAKSGVPPPTSSTSNPVPSATKTAAESARERVEALKARVAAAKARTTGDLPPERPAAQSSRFQPPPPSSRRNDFEDTSQTGINSARGGTGLNVGIHPALLGDINDRSRLAPKFRAKPRKQEPEKSNPYVSESTGYSGRAQRTLNFNHNLHSRPAMQAANEMRRKEALEAMKKRIQASAAKAGLEETTEIQVFAVILPPDVEFWDEGFQKNIINPDLITARVLHPIRIAPPQEKLLVKEQALKLNKKEQKKMRRIRRADEHKEEQAKIRLGLVPTPDPKVTHRNVMRVYGEMAVNNPTAVAAMVNKQVAERKETHETTNAERQLTKEQRAEKIVRKAQENAAMGLMLTVFKVALGTEKLHGKHRYKIDMNAKQHKDLTGCCIVAPSFTLILVEAGEHSTRKYKKLLVDRVKWKAILEGDGEAQPLDEDQDDDDNKDTTCTMVWQGQIRDRKFKRWGSVRNVETDIQAKEALTRANMENFWLIAKNSTD
jgi:U4/U6 small nuclear ribonucleoprotein PRP3